MILAADGGPVSLQVNWHAGLPLSLGVPLRLPATAQRLQALAQASAPLTDCFNILLVQDTHT